MLVFKFKCYLLKLKKKKNPNPDCENSKWRAVGRERPGGLSAATGQNSELKPCLRGVLALRMLFPEPRQQGQEKGQRCRGPAHPEQHRQLQEWPWLRAASSLGQAPGKAQALGENRGWVQLQPFPNISTGYRPCHKAGSPCAEPALPEPPCARCGKHWQRSCSEALLAE